MSECSFTKEESASIKGLLIFLIVLGHNFVFLDCFPSTYPYWYTFHVACFFILSYTYSCKKLKKTDS